MGCLLIYHPDILEFLESKSWDEGKLTHFNLSVLVDDEFMKAVENDSDIFLRYPCMDEKGLLIKDESKWETKTKINARYLWDLIMKKASRCKKCARCCFSFSLPAFQQALQERLLQLPHQHHRQ